MANQDVKVSALNSVSTLSTDDLSLETVVDELSETGYTSKKITEGAKASQYLEAFTFANLNTTAKTIVGAINEAATTGGAGDFPIHIHNSTITETAGEVLDAMADGLKPYVIWTNNSQSNYTFTYALAAVWNPDATTETLIFGCPVTGAVRTIHVYINPTTRTYSSSIQVVDYTIPQIDDSSTSSNKVWSAQKTNSELADKAEIDDTAVSSSTAWSSSQIASLLPTESASGAVASFETPLTLPLVSLNVTIDYKDTTGFSAVNVTRAGKNLFNKNAKDTTKGYLDNKYLKNDGTLGGNNDYYISEYIQVNAGENLTMSNLAGYSQSIAYYDSNKEYLSANAYFNANVKTITTPASCCFIRFSILKANADIIQIERSDTATTYEPYTATASTINLDGTIYGGSVDVTNGTVTSTKAQDGTDLPEPVVTTIDPTMINTLKGVNNIWADTGDTSVEFKQDIQTYIDSRLSSGTRTLNLAKAPVETEETKQEEQEGDEDVNR